MRKRASNLIIKNFDQGKEGESEGAAAVDDESNEHTKMRLVLLKNPMIVPEHMEDNTVYPVFIYVDA